MLVLSRKKGETIVIGDNIIVTVVEIVGDRVRLAFEAPKDVTIHRREIYDKIRHPQGTDEISPPNIDPGK
jgi:carbon storage regulator